jgi:class 3 adenylate cyclase
MWSEYRPEAETSQRTEMKTENLAIVFVDIAGFTPRTSAQTREENTRLLRRFDDVVRPIVRAYNGRVIKTMGDAFLLTFRSPTDALLCSMAIHDRIAETDADVDPAERFTIRAAVNVGEVRIDGGDVFGEAVNIASRIEGKAGAGDIYFSESVFLSMTKSEVPSEEVGYAELKGIPGKIRLYRVPRAGEPGGAPPKQRGSGSAAADNLPFGGLALDRVRGRLTAGTPAEVAVTQAQGLLMKLFEVVALGFARWKDGIRSSRAVQVGTALLVILAIVFTVWVMTHKPKPKPATPWQKLQRSLGL